MAALSITSNVFLLFIRLPSASSISPTVALHSCLTRKIAAGAPERLSDSDTILPMGWPRGSAVQSQPGRCARETVHIHHVTDVTKPRGNTAMTQTSPKIPVPSDTEGHSDPFCQSGSSPPQSVTSAANDDVESDSPPTPCRSDAEKFIEALAGDVAAAAALPVGYRPRAPEKTPLHVAVRRGLAPFLEQTSRRGGLPGFVVRELEAYLGCGVLANG
jgi:hypothetical protein